MNSDIKEYDEQLVMISNIHINYIVDNKLGHYWYKVVTRNVISEGTEENSTHIIQIQVTMKEEARGGIGDIPQTQHI